MEERTIVFNRHKVFGGRPVKRLFCIFTMGCNNVKPAAAAAGEILMTTMSDDPTDKNWSSRTAMDADGKNNNFLTPQQANTQLLDVEDIEKIKGKLGEEFGEYSNIIFKNHYAYDSSIDDDATQPRSLFL